MTLDEKELLLVDISGRLPYGVICSTCMYPNLKLLGINKEQVQLDAPIYDEGDDYWYIEDVKPYLRLMSSMTEEERNEYSNFEFIDASHFAHAKEAGELTNWLNKHHFDYRGLIPMGLALEATEGMYK